MARRNYDKMYEEKNTETAPVEESTVEEASAPEPEKEEIQDEKPSKDDIPATKPFMGKVTGGLSLNVRKTPGGEVVSALSDGAQVRVMEAVDKDWYRIEEPAGFVMKKFIKKA